MPRQNEKSTDLLRYVDYELEYLRGLVDGLDVNDRTRDNAFSQINNARSNIKTIRSRFERGEGHDGEPVE